mmetsp:Transcript_1415/g.1926  ORF Transcript_1415/g.1926 Transcript_1415/m.1926 type:complete len:521 (+) Transcript_1415:79-1641(+)
MDYPGTNTSDLLFLIETLQQELDELALQSTNSTTWIFILICAFDIFLMQAGFALLEVGTVQAKNAKSILFKNSMDCAVSMIIWWVIGYGIAGGGASGQEGRSFCYVSDENTLSFIHSYVFAGASATIVSGGVAERMNFSAYLIFSCAMVGVIYPTLAFWGWSSEGWLLKLGYLDFAGSGLIHACGGISAMVGAMLVGPRFGRFKKQDGMVEVVDIKGHSPVLSNFGTFVLLFGWMSFNGSSVLGGTAEDLRVAARAILNTLLSVASAALTSLFWSSKPDKSGKPSTHNLEELNNAMLAGAVGITASCAFVEGWAALIIGIVSFFIFHKHSAITVGLHIDDPLEASAVHGACGAWGVLAVGIFAHPRLTGGSKGIVFGGGHLLGVQLLGLCVISLWTAVLSFIIFKCLDQIPGCQLRVEKDAELLGLDFAHHDGFAYPELSTESVSHFNEMKAAERRVQARNRGMKKTPKKKVKDLKSAASNNARKIRVISTGEDSTSGVTWSKSYTETKDGTAQAPVHDI